MHQVPVALDMGREQDMGIARVIAWMCVQCAHDPSYGLPLPYPEVKLGQLFVSGCYNC